MEIKKHLKALDVKISRLASELGVSRPTLDAYIDYFEKGQPIPNEGYQRIFDYLFSGEEINSLEFAQRYDYVKRVMLADAKAGAEKNAESKKQSAILKNIEDSISAGALSTPLLNYINLLVNNKDNNLVQAICLYFNFTNGYLAISESEVNEKNKALFSQLARVFSDYQANKIECIQEYYNQMLENNKAIFEKKKIVVNDSDIIEYIKTKLDDASGLDLEVLKQMIKSREVK